MLAIFFTIYVLYYFIYLFDEHPNSTSKYLGDDAKEINIPKNYKKSLKKDTTKQKNIIENSQSIIKRDIQKSSAIVKYENQEAFYRGSYLS